MKIKVCVPVGAIFIDLKLAAHAIVVCNWESDYLWILLLSHMIKDDLRVPTDLPP